MPFFSAKAFSSCPFIKYDLHSGYQGKKMQIGRQGINTLIRRALWRREHQKNSSFDKNKNEKKNFLIFRQQKNVPKAFTMPIKHLKFNGGL
jgi:hypothetical protein